MAIGGFPPGAVVTHTSQQVSINTYDCPQMFGVDVVLKCRDCGINEDWSKGGSTTLLTAHCTKLLCVAEAVAID